MGRKYRLFVIISLNSVFRKARKYFRNDVNEAGCIFWTFEQSANALCAILGILAKRKSTSRNRTHPAKKHPNLLYSPTVHIHENKYSRENLSYANLDLLTSSITLSCLYVDV